MRIYNRVPPIIETNILRFIRWSPAVVIRATSSGMPWFPFITFTSLRQYTTNMAKMAEGRAFPKYWIYLGVLPSLKIIKGRKRVRMVAMAHIPIVIICSSILILFHRPFDRLFENG